MSRGLISADIFLKLGVKAVYTFYLDDALANSLPIKFS
jgi:hypothetical protein